MNRRSFLTLTFSGLLLATADLARVAVFYVSNASPGRTTSTT